MSQDAAERSLADEVYALMSTKGPKRMHTVAIAHTLNRGKASKDHTDSSKVFRACYDDERFTRRPVGILTEYALK